MSKQETKGAKNAITEAGDSQKTKIKGSGNHPNSKKNLRHSTFSSTFQPDHYRGPGFQGLIKTALLQKLHQKSRIKVTGKDILTGQEVEIYVDTPNLDVIIAQWLRQAGRGNMKAIELLAERIDGKVPLPIIREPEDPGAKERVIVLANGNTLTM